MVLLAWICAMFLALSGAGLIVAGVYAGGTGGLVLGLGLGVVVAGGSIPFVRAARRMSKELRREPINEAERRSRRRRVRSILGFYAGCCLTTLLLPAPGVVRVIAVIATVMVVPLVLIGEFDKARRE